MAQAGLYPQALAEIRRGQKTGHWMWFVFPQLAGLGSSATAQRYAITSIGEARAYLAHPLLGARLRECSAAVVELTGLTAQEVFGDPDDLKLRSSLTLFEAASGGEAVFGDAPGSLCGGTRDERTLSRLAQKADRT